MAETHPCAGCGADLQWSPGDGDLKCLYCGTTTEVMHSEQTAAIVEHDLYAALMSAPKGWGQEVNEFRCTSCGAFTAVEAHITATECAFCGTTQMEVQPIEEDVLRPESLLPFAIEKKTAKSGFAKWTKTLWFRPNDLKLRAKMDGLAGVYVPIWTFDALTDSDWNAEAGFHYYVTVSYTDSQGNSKTRQEQRTRWEWRNGRVKRRFDDWLVQASFGLSQELFEGLLPYDTSGLVPYSTQYLAGFVAERYQMSLEDGWGVGKQGISAVVRAACANDVPGDTYRNLDVSTRWSHETFKHCLVPVWMSAYRYKDKVYHYVVNGVTGKMHGTAPYSVLKILGAILLGAAILAGLYYWSEQQ
jgi:hypothetical protein